MDRETPTEMTPSPNTPAKKSRSGVWLVVGVAAIVALLVFAGGALAVGRLSAPSREGGGDRPFGQRPEFQIEPAKELPTTTPSLRGIVTKRDGNTLSVGQRGGFGSGGNGSTPLVDVVVTADTTIYHDTTQMSFNGQPPSGPVPQKVEPGTLAGVSVDSRVTVWGDQNGSQLTAKVLVYMDPIAFRQSQ